MAPLPHCLITFWNSRSLHWTGPDSPGLEEWVDSPVWRKYPYPLGHYFDWDSEAESMGQKAQQQGLSSCPPTNSPRDNKIKGWGCWYVTNIKPGNLSCPSGFLSVKMIMQSCKCTLLLKNKREIQTNMSFQNKKNGGLCVIRRHCLNKQLSKAFSLIVTSGAFSLFFWYLIDNIFFWRKAPITRSAFILYCIY